MGQVFAGETKKMEGRGKICGLLGTCLWWCRNGELVYEELSLMGVPFVVAGVLTQGNVFWQAELPLVGGMVAWSKEIAELLCVLACPFRMCTSPTFCG